MKKESDFVNQVNLNLNARQKLAVKEVFATYRRHLKYASAELMRKSDMVNGCLNAMENVSYDEETMKSTTVSLQRLEKRVQYIPCIMKAISIAMVDERSSMLKAMRRGLHGKNSI